MEFGELYWNSLLFGEFSRKITHCAHMHCDVDLRSRRMWAASYRLTRLEMNENSEYLESFCTGHARVRAERGGDGGDGAVADAPVLGRRCCCGCAASLGGRGCVPGGVVSLGSPGRGGRRAILVRSHHASTRSRCPSLPSLRPCWPRSWKLSDGFFAPLRLGLPTSRSRPPAKFGENSIVGTKKCFCILCAQVRGPGRVAGGHARAQGDGDGSRWL